MSCSYRGIVQTRMTSRREVMTCCLILCVSAVLSCHVLISINALKVNRREQISCDFVVLHNVR